MCSAPETSNEDEVRAATGMSDTRAGISALRNAGPRILMLKRGGHGAVLFDGDRVVEVPLVRMEVVNGLGAGDAFLAALTHSVLARHRSRHRGSTRELVRWVRCQPDPLL